MELAEAREKQKLTEAQLRQALKEKEAALQKEQEERKRAEIVEIEALSTLSKALLLSHDHLGAGQIIAASNRNGMVQLWRLDGTLVQTIKSHSNWVSSVSFSPDGQTLACAIGDGTVKLWRIDGTELRTFQGHGNWVYDVSFSPDGQILASASGDSTVKFWRIDGTELQTFQGHGNWVYDVSFSPDGQKLASASRDGTIKVMAWNLNLDDLLLRGCNWLRDYLKTNPNVSESDRTVCENIERSGK